MCHISDNPEVLELQEKIKNLQSTAANLSGVDKVRYNNEIKLKKKELDDLTKSLGITSSKKPSLAN